MHGQHKSHFGHKPTTQRQNIHTENTCRAKDNTSRSVKMWFLAVVCVDSKGTGRKKNWHHNPYTHANTKTSSSDVNRMWDNHLHSGIFRTHRKNKKQQKKTLQINTIHTTKTSPNLLTCIWTFPRKSTRFSSHTRTKNNDSVQKCLLYLVPGVRDETADGFRWLLLRCNLSRRNRG